MTQVIIVEDEAVSARRMQRLLEARSLKVIQVISSNEQLESFFNLGMMPDLFVMDIHLNDGIVFESLQKHKIETPIIFTTAYDEYAIRAFKQNSIDYLLKPIDESELDRALIKFNKTKTNVDLKSLAALMQSQTLKTYKQRFSVRIGDKIRSFDVDELNLFYSSEKINYLRTTSGRAYPIDYTIEQVQHLIDPHKWFRVNRGYIVRISEIKDVINYSNSRLKVVVNDNSSHDIIVSREKVKAFKEWLG